MMPLCGSFAAEMHLFASQFGCGADGGDGHLLFVLARLRYRNNTHRKINLSKGTGIWWFSLSVSLLSVYWYDACGFCESHYDGDDNNGVIHLIRLSGMVKRAVVVTSPRARWRLLVVVVDGVGSDC